LCDRPIRLVRLHPPGWTPPGVGDPPFDPSASQHYLSIGSRFTLGLFASGSGRDGIGQNSFGISETSEMCGAYAVDVPPGGALPRAFFWSPRALGTIAANTAFDLHGALGGELGPNASVANALATSRTIVGLAGDDANTATRAWRWGITESGGVVTVIAADIHPTVAAPAEPSVAYAIDESIVGQVVGVAYLDCRTSGGPPRGFLEEASGANAVLLPPPAPSGHSFAYAIETATSTRIGGGEAATEPLSGPCGVSPDPTACESQSDLDAIGWSLGAPPPPFGYLGPGGDASIDSVVRNILDDQRAVGHAFVGPFPDCEATALYWDDTGVLPIDLGALAGDVQSRAEAIQRVGGEACGAIVGVREPDVDNRIAGLWCGSGSSWSTVDLAALVRWDADPETGSGGSDFSCSALPDDPTGPYGRWILEELHDVNSFGQAIGTMIIEATVESGGDPVLFQREAIALTAAEDINSDFRVNAIDLAIIVGAWGTNQNLPDLNADDAVDSLDLAIALGGWSGSDPCVVRLCNCGDGAPEGIGESGSDRSQGNQEVDLQLSFALSAIGFNSADEFAEWAAGMDQPSVLAALEALAAAAQLGGDA
jgi:hypothetical protein